VCASATQAQPPIAEWQKITKIKLLETTRDEVVALLAPTSFSSSRNDYAEYFYAEDSVVQVRYSNGTCSGEFEEWNTPEGTVTEVVVRPKAPIPAGEIGIDYSGFRKERTDPQRKSVYVRYDKDSGRAVSVFSGRIDSIYLFPSRQNYARLCNNAQVRNYYASKRWAREPMLKNVIIDYNSPANVTALSLGAIDGDERMISVSTTAVDPENDVLTYDYKISAGKIVGRGAKVVWDLSGVGTGTHSIAAGVDDGCGICGKYITRTVTIP